MSHPGRGIACVLLVGSLSVAGIAHEGSPEPPPRARTPGFDAPPPGSYELPPIQRLSPHRLLDERGREAPLLELEPGHLALVSFIYLSCGHACPRTTAVLQGMDRTLAERGLAGRVELVTVSFDPERDTPARMGAHRAALAPRGRWRFLTARDPASIDPVLADFGQDARLLLGPDGEPGPLISHVLKVFLVDSEGAVRNIYSTGVLDPRVILNDLLTLEPVGAAPAPPASAASPS
jgi:cytochrome oxidase Cu insertion factor (SCO1/SenC/PrrC family)